MENKSLENIIKVNGNLNMVIHDLFNCVGYFAKGDLVLDLTEMQSKLYTLGKASEFVDFMHCDPEHRMPKYSFRMDLSVVDEHKVKVELESLNETENEESIAAYDKFCELIGQRGGIYEIY